MKKLVIMLLALSTLAACKGSSEKVAALDLENFDGQVSPAENFYQYATGGWQKNNPLKPEFSRFGRFDELSELSVERVKGIFDNIVNEKQKPGTVGQKIADLYGLGMDSLKLNAEGAAPLKPYIEEIQAITNGEELAKVLAHMHRNGQRPFFAVMAMADMKNSTTNVGYLMQGGLGMGDRDYYLEAKNAGLKEGYRNFLATTLGLAGIEEPEKVADDVIDFETGLAQVQWSRVEQRDTWKAYNPMSNDEILEKYPNLNLQTYFETLGVEPQEKIIVRTPSYFEELNKILEKTPIERVKNYLLATLVQGGCEALSDDFYNAHFDFFSKQLTGTQEQKPRWKRIQTNTERLLSEAVGQLYVKKYFPEKDKIRMQGLVANIQKSLSQHIDELDWMSDETKAKAHEKLDNFTVKIGYPDKWKDYSDMVIDPKLSYYENLVRAANWRSADNLGRLGQPVDRTEWHMSPQTVNAYYNSTSNEICFPAAILQPPFFNPDADDAVNYGAIGVVISHEMSHGFDDQGRNFDKDGNMVDWWTPEDAEAFKERAAKLVAQFDAVEVLPGVHANGALCLGENIADLGGLNISFTAMQNAMGDNRPEPIDGLTPEQRFFLGYATVWAQNITDEEIARRTKMDSHSIGSNRVNVTIRNIAAFHDAFGIKEGDAMYLPEEERVVIW